MISESRLQVAQTPPAPRPGLFKVAVMQPTFAPWLGYFGLIAAADRFVLLDEAQVIFRSWHHRNRLFMPDGSVGWINAPIQRKGMYQARIMDTPVDLSGKEWAKLGRTIRQAYARTPCFDRVWPLVEEWMAGPPQNLKDHLADLNIRLIKAVSQGLGFEPEWVLSSELGVEGRRSALILDLLRKSQAAAYLSARGSFGYMAEEGLFPLAGLEVAFQDFRHPSYTQAHSKEFVSHLSILDALFNLGFEATARLIRESCAWSSWEEMEGTEKAPVGEEG